MSFMHHIQFLDLLNLNEIEFFRKTVIYKGSWMKCWGSFLVDYLQIRRRLIIISHYFWKNSPVDTRRNFNVCETSRRHTGCLLKVFCTFFNFFCVHGELKKIFLLQTAILPNKVKFGFLWRCFLLPFNTSSFLLYIFREL